MQRSGLGHVQLIAVRVWCKFRPEGACQTTAYAEEGGCLAYLFPYVWRTTRLTISLGGNRGRKDANIDLQRQFRA